MAYCASIFQSGGQNYLVVETVQSDVSTCALVVVSGAEYTDFHESASMWPALSVADAQIIAAPILVLFAVAWGFRAIAHYIKTSSNESE